MSADNIASLIFPQLLSLPQSVDDPMLLRDIMAQIHNDPAASMEECAAIDEAIVGAAPWRWRTGRLNRRDGEMDDGSSSGEVDEGRRAIAVDDVIGEEAPAGQR